MPRTEMGCWYTPPFASTPKATAICMGVMPLEPRDKPNGVASMCASSMPIACRKATELSTPTRVISACAAAVLWLLTSALRSVSGPA